MRADPINTARRTTIKKLAGVAAVAVAFPRAHAADPRSTRAIAVTEFGAIGDGRANDRAALNQALTRTESVYIPDGEYFLGEAGASETIFDMRARRSPLTIQTGARVRLVLRTREPGMPNVFGLAGGYDIRIGSLEIEDLGGDINQKHRGAIGVKVVPGKMGGSSLHVDRLVGKNLVAVVSVQRASQTERVSGVSIGELIAEGCYYGFNCQENGDDVVIGRLTAERCRRSYFVYGVRNHRVNVVSRNGIGASADVLIKRYRFDTRDIDVTYRCEHAGTSGPGNLVVLEQQPLEGMSPGQIANVHVAMSVNAPRLVTTPVLLRARTPESGPDGATEKLRTDDHWDQIEVEFGEMRTRSPLFVDTRVIPARKGALRIVGAGRENIGEKVFQGFDVKFGNRP